MMRIESDLYQRQRLCACWIRMTVIRAARIRKSSRAALSAVVPAVVRGCDDMTCRDADRMPGDERFVLCVCAFVKWLRYRLYHLPRSLPDSDP